MKFTNNIQNILNICLIIYMLKLFVFIYHLDFYFIILKFGLLYKQQTSIDSVMLDVCPYLL